jgi:hypothetical protein
MPWTHGSMQHYSPSKDANETIPAWVNGDVSIACLGEHNGHSVFFYRSGAVEFPFIASRFSRDRVLTDTWTIDWTNKTDGVKDYKGEIAVRPEDTATARPDIEGALLADPSWPDDFRRPDLPPQSVCFDEHDPFNLRGQRTA